jgi:hypothetical protein
MDALKSKKSSVSRTSGHRISSKEKGHYKFLNNLKEKYSIDPSKIATLEARLCGKFIITDL